MDTNGKINLVIEVAPELSEQGGNNKYKLNVQLDTMTLDQMIHRIPSKSLRKFIEKRYFNFRQATWRLRPFPDFLIIGAQRAGTTSLHEYLCQHPQIIPSPYSKELHFFDSSGRLRRLENYQKGESWYRAHFPTRLHIGEQSKVFESTPAYLYNPLAADRIHALIPEVKLIAILRNPTDRAISHFSMMTWKGDEHLPIIMALQAEEQRLSSPSNQKMDFPENFAYKSIGLYAQQIERYLSYFPLDHMLFIKSEDFFQNPSAVLPGVLNFIEVQPDFTFKNLFPHNTSRRKEDVPSEVRKYLDDYFSIPNQKLYSLIGRDLGW